MKSAISSADIIIFAGGIVAAVAVGVYAYQEVGPYGDGAYGSGFHRDHDPKTGQSIIFRETETSQGRVRRVFDESFRVTEIQIDSDRDGRIDAIIAVDSKQATATIDTDNDGVIDRWEHYDVKGALTVIGASSRRDGIEDTRSYVNERGLLIKVETDLDRDGSIDKREIFGPSTDGTRQVLLVVETEFDRTGSPRLRLRYRPDGTFAGSERPQTP